MIQPVKLSSSIRQTEGLQVSRDSAEVLGSSLSPAWEMRERDGLPTPAVRHSVEQIDVDVPIEQSQIMRFRALVARGNYLAAGWPEC